MLNSKKKKKRHCKVTLNVYFNKQLFDNDKKSFSYDRFIVSNQVLLLNMSKLLKTPGFFLISQIPCFLVKWKSCK